MTSALHAEGREFDPRSEQEFASPFFAFCFVVFVKRKFFDPGGQSDCFFPSGPAPRSGAGPRFPHRISENRFFHYEASFFFSKAGSQQGEGFSPTANEQK